MNSELTTYHVPVMLSECLDGLNIKPNGTYVDLVTGDKKSGSTISTGSIGQGNMRVYVLQNDTATKYGATKQIGKAGAYLK